MARHPGQLTVEPTLITTSRVMRAQRSISARGVPMIGGSGDPPSAGRRIRIGIASSVLPGTGSHSVPITALSCVADQRSEADARHWKSRAVTMPDWVLIMVSPISSRTPSHMPDSQLQDHLSRPAMPAFNCKTDSPNSAMSRLMGFPLIVDRQYGRLHSRGNDSMCELHAKNPRSDA